MRPFLDFIREHRNGKFHDDLSLALAEVVRAVELHRKPGKLTLSINITPVGEMQGAVAVFDDIAIKPPKLPKSSVFFTDGDSLTKTDPSQANLPLRPVIVQSRQKVDPETGEVTEETTDVHADTGAPEGQQEREVYRRG